MIGRNVPFERELIEPRSPFDLSMSHHDLALSQRESVRATSCNSAPCETSA